MVVTVVDVDVDVGAGVEAAATDGRKGTRGLATVGAEAAKGAVGAAAAGGVASFFLLKKEKRLPCFILFLEAPKAGVDDAGRLGAITALVYGSTCLVLSCIAKSCNELEV